ncbi:RDD family protein [Streptomyces sp. NPDC057280]|uniref:RDD family protein n=1 Tax=Streptomyces sp. NPDC057280 TaxID=3346081 RepID=UPI00362AD2A2
MSAPTPAPGDDRPREGYYPDPSIPGYVRYWNGAAWVPGTSRPAPTDGTPPTPPGAGAGSGGTGGAVPPVEETGPHFFDEDPRPQASPSDAQHGNRPEPASAWGADRGHQSGFGGDQDRRVSWGAPAGADPRVPSETSSTDGTATIPPARDASDVPSGNTFVFRRPTTGQQGGAGQGAAASGAGAGGAGASGGPAFGAPSAGGPAGAGSAAGRPAGAATPGVPGPAGPVGDEGTMTFRAVPPRTAQQGGAQEGSTGGAHAAGAAAAGFATPAPSTGPSATGGPASGGPAFTGPGTPASGAPATGGPAFTAPGAATSAAPAPGTSASGGPAFTGPGTPASGAPAPGTSASGGPAFTGPGTPASGAPASGGPAFTTPGAPGAAAPAAPGFGAGKAAAERAAGAQAQGGVSAQAAAPAPATASPSAAPTALSGPQPANPVAGAATPSVPQQPTPASAPMSSGSGGGQPSWAQQVHRLAGASGEDQPVLPWKPPVDDIFQAAARRQASARPAGLGKRLAARLLDTVVVLGVTAVAAVPLGTKALDHVDEKIDAAKLSGETVTVWLLDGTTSTYLGVILAVLLLFGVLYEALPTAKWGRTFGKKLLGLEVRDIEGGEPPSFGAALRRWLVYSVPGLLAIGVVGVVWGLFDKPWRQCWHDKAAHTFVAG